MNDISYTRKDACHILGISKSTLLKWNNILNIAPKKCPLSKTDLFMFKVLKIYLFDHTYKANDFIGIDWSQLISFFYNFDVKLHDCYYLNFRNDPPEFFISDSLDDVYDFNSKNIMISFNILMSDFNNLLNN